MSIPKKTKVEIETLLSGGVDPLAVDSEGISGSTEPFIKISNASNSLFVKTLANIVSREARRLSRIRYDEDLEQLKEKLHCMKYLKHLKNLYWHELLNSLPDHEKP